MFSRWCEVIVLCWMVYLGGLIHWGACRSTMEVATSTMSTLRLAELEDMLTLLNETAIDAAGMDRIVHLLASKDSDSDSNSNSNNNNSAQANQSKKFTYEPTIKTSNELDEKINSHHMSLVFERELRVDPAILLLILQNDTDILVTRRVNKYYYWEFAQTASAMVIFCMVVVGNLSILYKLKSFRRRRSNVNYFIVQLAIVDLLVGIFNVTLDSVFRLQREFTYGLVACRTSKYITNVFIYASTYMLVALSIDRWEAVVRPLAFTRNPNRGCYLVLGAWALAALSATPVTLHTNIKHIDGIPQCWIVMDRAMWRIYTVYVTCSVLVVPACIIAICYTHIVHTIWSKGRQVQRQERQHQQQLEDRLAAATEQCSSSDEEPAGVRVAAEEAMEEEEWLEKYTLNDCLRPHPAPLKEVAGEQKHLPHAQVKASGGCTSTRHRHRKLANKKPADSCQAPVSSQHGRSVIPRARIKTIKMTLVIVVTFVLCWSPFCIINLCLVFGLLPKNSPLSVALPTLSQSLAHLNSAVNPIIFWLFSSKGPSAGRSTSATSKSATSAAAVAASLDTCKNRASNVPAANLRNQSGCGREQPPVVARYSVETRYH